MQPTDSRSRLLRRRLSSSIAERGFVLSRESARLTRARLAAAAFTYSTVYLVAYVTGFVFGRPAGTFGAPEIVGLMAMVFGLTAGLAFRAGWPRDAALVNVGLAFYVLGAIGIDLSIYPSYLRTGVWPNGLSWVCVWIVVFPLLVPAPPKRLLAASMLAALTGPAALAGTAAMYPTPEGDFTPQLAALVVVPYFICAGTAWFTSKQLYRLRAQAAEARELGSYTLERKLGEGGMGQVWLAHHRFLARPAAVKLLRPERLRPFDADVVALTRRFEREARATASLRSPHTVDLYDFGITDDGSFYYAMEYLEGTDLERFVRRFGPLSPARVAHLLLQICESLEEAHGRGLVHRDIKPSNVFLCRVGVRYDVAKVLDFGLVAALPSSTVDITRATFDGHLTGTPAYMPPEVALEEGSVGPRSDLYSLGCTAYWMLTGTTVFQADAPMALLLKHVRETPRPLNEVAELEVPRDLEAAIMACLAKDPEDRPPSAAAFAASLRACDLADWTNDQARRWWDLHGASLREEQEPPETPEGPPLDRLSARPTASR